MLTRVGSIKKLPKYCGLCPSRQGEKSYFALNALKNRENGSKEVKMQAKFSHPWCTFVKFASCLEGRLEIRWTAEIVPNENLFWPKNNEVFFALQPKFSKIQVFY
jgi:hypothetical protein